MRKEENMAIAKNPTEELRKKSYMIGKSLIEREFIPSFPDEYALCIFCWSRISGDLLELNDSFYEEESESWVCPECVKKYEEAFQWEIIRSKKITFLEYLQEEEDLEIPLI